MCTKTWHFQPIVAFKSAAHIKKSYYYVLGYYVYDIVNFVGGNQCWKTKKVIQTIACYDLVYCF